MYQKKIIIFMPSIEGGGVEKNLFIISNYLSSKFDQIKLITLSNNTKKFNKKIKIENYEFLKKIVKLRILKIIFCSFFLLLELIKNKNCVIFSFQANLYSIIISKLLKKKIVIRLNSSPKGWIKNNIQKKIFKKIYSYADLIIVNSIEFKKHLDSILQIKSVCIYNPIDKKNIINKSKIKLKKNPYRYANSLKIINIGRLVDQKDHLTLFKAIKKIKDKITNELIVIGQGKQHKNLKNFIISNDLKKRIQILKFKNNPFPYLKLSDLFILSSKYEGLPNVLLEAIALKKFIISSNCPSGPKGILKNGKYGLLFKVGSVKDLVKKIKLYIDQKKNNKKKINLAYKSLNRFNYSKNLKKYYQGIINLF